MLPSLESVLYIPVLLDVLDIEIPALLGLNVLDGNNLLFKNLKNHPWSRIITKKDPLRFKDRWKIKLIRKGDHLYVPLSTRIQ